MESAHHIFGGLFNLFQGKIGSMDIDLTTPALLLPAVSLLLLVYANRFLTVAKIIRDLHAAFMVSRKSHLAEEIQTLTRRILLIRSMQMLAIGSLFMCVLCMFVLFAGSLTLGKLLFVISLILLLCSLALSLREIHISVHALVIHLRDLNPGKVTE